MDFKELKEKNPVVADLIANFYTEANTLFDKYLEKSPEHILVAIIHLSINFILYFLENDEDNFLYSVFPTLPDMFLEFATPFKKVEKQWGEIAGPLFAQIYRDTYEAQFQNESKMNALKEICESVKKNY